MKWELKGTTLTVIAETGDKWKGSTTAQRVETVQGIECLRCGQVKVGRKRVSLCVRIDDKPGLAELIKEWAAAKQAKEAAEKAAEEAEYAALRDGSTAIVASYHDGEYLSDYQVFGKAAELLAELCGAKYVNGWGYAVERKVIDSLGIEFTLPQVAELLKPEIEEKEKAEAERKAHDEQIEAKRQELVDAGTRLATPKQLAVIAGAREDWFDLFDGCGSYGMHGPSDDELRLMTIEEASRLVGQVIEARKDLRLEGGY